MEWFEVVVLGLVLAVALSRFFKYPLPKDKRPRASRRADLDKLLKRPTPDEPKEPLTTELEAAQTKAKVSPVKKVSAKELEGLSGLEKIRALDPAFDEETFKEGARKAYTYFYTCWNAKDEQGLVQLCAPRLVDELVPQWDRGFERKMVESVEDVAIGEAKVVGRTAMVHAIITARRKDGKARAKVVESDWLFARALGSDDPNWQLETMTESKR